VSFFSKLQTSIEIIKNTKVKSKHFFSNIQKNNKNKNHMKIKNKKNFSLALDHSELCELSINLKSFV
jgi:hypothetical protein